MERRTVINRDRVIIVKPDPVIVERPVVVEKPVIVHLPSPSYSPPSKSSDLDWFWVFLMTLVIFCVPVGVIYLICSALGMK